MKMLRMTILLGALLWAASASAVAPILGDLPDYARDTKRNYPTIITARILSSKTVSSADGRECFFEYSAELKSTVRGNYGKPKLEFFSEVGLTTGDEYLIYWSEPDAKVFRMALGPKVARCSKLMTSYFLLYTELHLIKDALFRGKIIRAVQFSDVSVDFPPYLMTDEVKHLYPFDVVQKRLGD